MLKRKFDKKEEIPSGFEGLYEEKDGAWVLKPIEGLKPAEEYNSVSNSLIEARNSLNELNEKYKHFKDLDPKDVLSKLDKYSELEKLAGKNQISEDEIKKIADIRTAQLKRELDEAVAKMKTFETENSTLKTEKISAKLKSVIDDLVFDKETKDLRVYAGTLKDIQIRAERDLEYNETLGGFVTKDTERLPPKDWYSKQIKEGAMWEKGSRGEPENNGNRANLTKSGEGGTIEENIAEIWSGK